jgi:predicted dehydrogenase
MIAARDKSGKMLMTAQHFRFQTDTQALKREIETGILGDVITRALGCCAATGCRCPRFHYKKNSGGGPCIDIGVHILDLTLWMMGQPNR